MQKKGKNLVVLDGSLTKVNRDRSAIVTKEDIRKKVAVIVGVAALAVIMLLAMLQGMVSLCASLSSDDGERGELSPLEKLYTDRDSLSVLLMKEADGRGSVEHFVLVRFEPSEGRVFLTPISPELITDGRTLQQHYALGGEAQCCLALEQLLGCSKIHYTAFTYTTLRELVDAFGGVTIDLKYSFNYKAADNKRNINVAAGKRVFLGGETARLLNCPEWPGGETEQRMMYAQVFASLINEQLTPSGALRLETLYGKVYNNTVSNVSMGSFQSAFDGLAYLGDINDSGSIASVYELYPQSTESGLFFDETVLAQMRALYGDRDVSE